MACAMAFRPSFASLIIARFVVFSSFRSSVAVARLLLNCANESVSCLMSSASWSRFTSRAANSTSNVFTSSSLAARVSVAFPSSVSHQPFFVASVVASASSRSMSFWMSFLTSMNGSSASFAARTERAVLPMRRASSCSSRVAASRCACAEAPACARARKLLWLRTWADTPWRKDMGSVVLACFSAPFACCGVPVAARAAMLALRPCFWSSTRLFTAVSRSVTLFFRIISAPCSASSSSFRSFVRWSQSLARWPQRSVRSVT
mmetsp:Transcript_13421/g.37118  ORF Transcript_13421/g.37118 Transcript_13421/m.37118 type:complete len:262 (+) Transcript_13421:674-1459(+)